MTVILASAYINGMHSTKHNHLQCSRSSCSQNIIITTAIIAVLFVCSACFRRFCTAFTIGSAVIAPLSVLLDLVRVMPERRSPGYISIHYGEENEIKLNPQQRLIHIHTHTHACRMLFGRFSHSVSADWTNKCGKSFCFHSIACKLTGKACRPSWNVYTDKFISKKRE